MFFALILFRNGSKQKITNNYKKKFDFFQKKSILPFIMREKILKLNDIKNKNYRTVLDILLQSKGLSRVELAQKMGCDNTTVSRAVRALIDRGIIVHGKKNEQDHGRPRITLELNPDGPVLIGVSLEAERITGVITDLRGKVREKKQVIFQSFPSKELFFQELHKILNDLKQLAGTRLSGIGAAVFGNYSGTDFTLENAAALPALNGVNLQKELNKAAGLPVTICDHLVSKMSFLERELPEFNTGTVMLISAGSGIGSLIAENGRFLFTRNNHSGEFGHSICIPGGEPCSCGRKGCLETVVSIRALLRICREKLEQPDLSFEQLCGLYQSGNKNLAEEVDKCAEYLSTAISNQLNCYPVDKLVITGRLLELGPGFQEKLESAITSSLFTLYKQGLTKHFVRLDYDNSLARGAAIFAGRFIDVCSDKTEE